MTNTKSTRRALLASVMSILLCFTMLLGTTYAWFTDSAVSSGNKIVAGTLDVQLLMNADGTGYTEISNSTSPIFGSNSLLAQNNNADTLWEPGKTQVAYLAIANNGNLDLKYTVGLNVQNVSKDLYEVMEYAIVPDAQYGDGTVTDWTSGNTVVVGTQSVSGDVELKVGETHYFALVVHMDEEAGNEYMGGEVNFDLTVLATQLASEEDSFNNQYDKDAEYPVVDAEGLAGAIAEGKNVKLEADITLTDAITIDGNVTVDLNGFDLDSSALDSAFFVASGSDVTVKIEGTDEEVKLGKNGLVDVAAGADAVIEINGGSFISNDAGSTLIKPDGDGEIKIILNDVDYKSTAANGYVLDCSYYDGSNLSVEINGGSFEATTGLLLPEGSSVKGATITAKNTKNMQPAVYAMGDMTIENCIIKAEKSHAVAVAGGATLTINNCEVYAGSDANALAFQVFSSGGTINVNNTTYNGSYGTTGKMSSGCVAIINIDGVEVYRKG